MVKVFLVLNLITVLLLLINKDLAFVFTLISIAVILVTFKGGFIERFLPVLIYESAFYNIISLGKFSFMEITLILYVIVGLFLIFFKDYKINFYLLLITITGIVFLIIGVTLSLDSNDTYRNIYKLIILMLNIFVTFTIVTNKPNLQQPKINSYLNMYLIVTFSLSIGVIFQFIAHNYFGLELGEIFYYGSGRTIYNLYFYPKSVLSAFICSGAIIVLIRMYKDFKLSHLLIIMVMLSATVINTSRTGLIILIIVFLLYMVKNSSYIVKNYKTFLILLILVVGFLFAIESLLGNRSTELLDDNGRFKIIMDSKAVMMDNLLLGIGSSWDDLHTYGIDIEIHNFIFQYLLQMGLIVTVSLLLSLIFVLNKLKSLEFFYVALFTCLVGTLYTYWHHSLFINCIFIIGLLCVKNDYKYL